MRIGTWNLDARWDGRHREFVEDLGCDILLLTEVKPEAEISGMVGHHTTHRMARGQSWAAIYAADVRPLPDPHPATALAVVDGFRICSSILPWRGCGPYWPWGGDTNNDRVAHVVDRITKAGPDIWGGDWNTSFAPGGYAGAPISRSLLPSSTDRLRLHIATTELQFQDDAGLTIDHVAVPAHWTVRSATRHRVGESGTRLSDHDAYVVAVSTGECDGWH